MQDSSVLKSFAYSCAHACGSRRIYVGGNKYLLAYTDIYIYIYIYTLIDIQTRINTNMKLLRVRVGALKPVQGLGRDIYIYIYIHTHAHTPSYTHKGHSILMSEQGFNLLPPCSPGEEVISRPSK